LFSSQRTLKSDCTEFKQRAAYFAGDPVIATKKGVNVLEGGSHVSLYGRVPGRLPALPKLDVLGKLDPGKTTRRNCVARRSLLRQGHCEAARAILGA
jgi:hypothetical protein